MAAASFAAGTAPSPGPSAVARATESRPSPPTPLPLAGEGRCEPFGQRLGLWKANTGRERGAGIEAVGEAGFDAGGLVGERQRVAPAGQAGGQALGVFVGLGLDAGQGRRLPSWPRSPRRPCRRHRGDSRRSRSPQGAPHPGPLPARGARGTAETRGSPRRARRECWPRQHRTHASRRRRAARRSSIWLVVPAVEPRRPLCL